MKTLDVYLHRDLVGRLIQDEHGQMVFDYAEEWLARPKAMPLSHSLPLRPERFTTRECRGFFGGILPEERKRELIARILGISARNDYAMLERIGGECAGAVTFIPEGEELPPDERRYRSLNEDALTLMLKTLPRRPLMVGEEGVRLSLAGAQDKIAVCVKGDEISLPLGGAPSTHILKPAIEHFEGTVFNEAISMRLAAAVGLPVAAVELREVQGIEYLLIERYDRRPRDGGKGGLVRLHQEDFCQALGIPSELKYQNEGGPSLADCFRLLREVSAAPVIDLRQLLDAVIFNVLIGNHDAHAKNFSLLYDERTAGAGRNARLAPLYDLVSTVLYPELSPKMAMKIGGEYRSNDLFRRHFERLASDIGMAKPMVVRRVPELAEEILAKIDGLGIAHPTAEAVTALVKERCHEFIRLFRDK